MTSISELIYNRRYRLGRNAHLDLNPPHHQDHRNLNRLRLDRACAGDEICHQFHPSHGGHRISQPERESVQLDHGTRQTGMGNNSSMEYASTRTNTPRVTRNGPLPGAVLQAKARLLERLRGVSLTENRQSRTASRIPWDEHNDFNLNEAVEWETEIPSEQSLQANALSVNSTVQAYPIKKKPPGLSREAISSLHREVFHNTGEQNELSAVQECSICLESFHEGDGLIYLPCGHRFHSLCLDPWVRSSGDCPYCRTGIVVLDSGVKRR